MSREIHEVMQQVNCYRELQVLISSWSTWSTC